MRHFNLIISAAVTISAIAGISAASAADLPARTYTKAPPMAVPMYDWSGFYIGINGGGGSARNCWAVANAGAGPINPPAFEGCENATGATAGGQIGYRWQSASWVFGLESQGNWANFKGRNNNNLVFPGFLGDTSKLNAFGLFTGQVGYAVNNVLFYLKGGAAVTSDKYNNFSTIALPPFAVGQDVSAGSETRWGGVIGAGFEYGFAPNWSVALEYDHMFMGTQSVTLNLIPPSPTPGLLSSIQNIGQNVDIGTVRVNYRFGGPVVARY
jgi:outer membrane immunogenic protein